MNYFYLDQANQKQGPVSEQQLRELANNKIIGPNTPMITDTGHKGVAGQIPGLFPTAQTAYPPPPPPPPPKQLFCTNCAHPVHENAVGCMSCGLKPTGHKNFCRNCGGARNPDPKVVICTQCGVSLGATFVPDARKVIDSVVSSSKNETVKKLFIGGIALAVVVGFIWFVLPMISPFFSGEQFTKEERKEINAFLAQYKKYEKDGTRVPGVPYGITLTPLHYAVHEENLPAVRYLVSRGADVNEKISGSHVTTIHIIHYAVMLGNVDILQYLISKGANVNAESREGTPLALAMESKDVFPTRRRNIEVIQCLVSNGADVNGIIPRHGLSYLHLAAMEGNLELVRLFVSNGADIHVYNDRFGTPLNYVRNAVEKNSYPADTMLDCTRDEKERRYRAIIDYLSSQR